MKRFALSLLFLTGCENHDKQWDAFIYTGDTLLTHESLRGFKTLELCREAAIARLRSKRPDGGGDYECGYKCRPLGSDGDMSICEETRK